jgi:hypothetical protein
MAWTAPPSGPSPTSVAVARTIATAPSTPPSMIQPWVLATSSAINYCVNTCVIRTSKKATRFQAPSPTIRKKSRAELLLHSGQEPRRRPFPRADLSGSRCVRLSLVSADFSPTLARAAHPWKNSRLTSRPATQRHRYRNIHRRIQLWHRPCSDE